MKEASGELSMTAITVVAIGAIALIFYNFVWPMIQRTIVQNTCDTMGHGWTVETSKKGTDCIAADADKDAGGSTYYCCPPTK